MDRKDASQEIRHTHLLVAPERIHQVLLRAHHDCAVNRFERDRRVVRRKKLESLVEFLSVNRVTLQGRELV